MRSHFKSHHRISHYHHCRRRRRLKHQQHCSICLHLHLLIPFQKKREPRTQKLYTHPQRNWFMVEYNSPLYEQWTKLKTVVNWYEANDSTKRSTLSTLWTLDLLPSSNAFLEVGDFWGGNPKDVLSASSMPLRLSSNVCYVFLRHSWRKTEHQMLK